MEPFRATLGAEILKQIHNENWSELKVLTGTADHVPDAILGLLSENKSAFEAAYWKLENYVVVQGDLFSSAAVVPKFLEDIVVKAKFKERVIDLIWQIGSGYSKDTHLQEECFNEAMRVLKRLENNPKIYSSKYGNIVKGEIKELEELKIDREKST